MMDKHEARLEGMDTASLFALYAACSDDYRVLDQASRILDRLGEDDQRRLRAAFRVVGRLDDGEGLSGGLRMAAAGMMGARRAGLGIADGADMPRFGTPSTM